MSDPTCFTTPLVPLLYVHGLGAQAIIYLSLGVAELQLARVKQSLFRTFGRIRRCGAYVLAQLLADMPERLGHILHRFDQRRALFYQPVRPLAQRRIDLARHRYAAVYLFYKMAPAVRRERKKRDTRRGLEAKLIY